MPSRTPEEGTEELGSSLRDTDAGLKGEKMGEGVAICRQIPTQSGTGGPRCECVALPRVFLWKQAPRLHRQPSLSICMRKLRLELQMEVLLAEFPF